MCYFWSLAFFKTSVSFERQLLSDGTDIQQWFDSLIRGLGWSCFHRLHSKAEVITNECAKLHALRGSS